MERIVGLIRVSIILYISELPLEHSVIKLILVPTGHRD